MRRVVLTGTGLITPVGHAVDAFFEALQHGRSGVARFEGLPDQARLRATLGAQVRGFDPAAHFPAARLGALDRFSQFALVAARQAMQQAGSPRWAEGRAGVYFGTGMGGAITLEQGYDALFRRQQNRVAPLSVIATMPNAAAANLGIEFGLDGACQTYAVACASSAVAIGEAFRAIRAGWLDAALAGGSEAILSFGMIKGWEGLMTLAVEDRSAPETSCRPFAKDRSGFVLGEGAGALVLEEREQALQRGATVLAEVVGYGASNDALHLSRPESAGQIRALRQALGEAAALGVTPSDVGYVNAHGTATRAGDLAEVQSLRAAFGEHAGRLAVSSTKALHGHLMGAGGAVEFIAAVEALRREVLPPTAHLRQPDPELDLDFIAEGARPAPGLRAVLSSSFAFGGSNAVLVAAHADRT